MVRASSPTSPCPVCGARASSGAENPNRPFCTERCRLVDLSRWLDGDYVIPGADGEAGSSEGSDDTPTPE